MASIREENIFILLNIQQQHVSNSPGFNFIQLTVFQIDHPIITKICDVEGRVVAKIMEDSLSDTFVKIIILKQKQEWT